MLVVVPEHRIDTPTIKYARVELTLLSPKTLAIGSLDGLGRTGGSTPDSMAGISLHWAATVR